MRQKYPQKYAEVAKRNPVLTPWQWRQIQEHEYLAGDALRLTQP